MDSQIGERGTARAEVGSNHDGTTGNHAIRMLTFCSHQEELAGIVGGSKRIDRD